MSVISFPSSTHQYNQDNAVYHPFDFRELFEEFKFNLSLEGSTYLSAKLQAKNYPGELEVSFDEFKSTWRLRVYTKLSDVEGTSYYKTYDSLGHLCGNKNIIQMGDKYCFGFYEPIKAIPGTTSSMYEVNRRALKNLLTAVSNCLNDTNGQVLDLSQVSFAK